MAHRYFAGLPPAIQSRWEGAPPTTLWEAAKGVSLIEEKLLFIAKAQKRTGALHSNYTEEVEVAAFRGQGHRSGSPRRYQPNATYN